MYYLGLEAAPAISDTFIVSLMVCFAFNTVVPRVLASVISFTSKVSRRNLPLSGSKYVTVCSLYSGFKGFDDRFVLNLKAPGEAPCMSSVTRSL